MKASKLIIELTKLMSEHGDKNVIFAGATLGIKDTAASESYFSTLSVVDGECEFELYGEEHE